MREKLAKIKLLVTDFDGVLTDGYVYVDQEGRETVCCSRKDGLGVLLLQRAGIEVIIISKEENPVVTARARKMKAEYYQGIHDSFGKLAILKKISEDKNIKLDEIAYIGDDLNDYNVLGQVGVFFTVADGHKKLKTACDYITSAKGGEHAFREICELILESQGREISF